jgi:hypothetical protein
VYGNYERTVVFNTRNIEHPFVKQYQKEVFEIQTIAQDKHSSTSYLNQQLIMSLLTNKATAQKQNGIMWPPGGNHNKFLVLNVPGITVAEHAEKEVGRNRNLKKMKK